jgi:hypothetical protein
MSGYFDIKSNELIDLALILQQLNDVSLSFAVQNTLNDVARKAKTESLMRSAKNEFNVQRPAFFKANSGYKPHYAKEFGYNINKLKAEVGITAANKPHDKATEQIGSQETASPIKRSINPLGEKPQTQGNIDVLSKKPEIYDSTAMHAEGNSLAFLRTILKAKSKGSGIIFAKSGRGTLRKINYVKTRRPTKADPRKYSIKTTPIASYIHSGSVKLRKERPFLTNAVAMSLQEVQAIFEKRSKEQIERLQK